MNIAFVVASLSKSYGGPPRSTCGLADSLFKKGVKTSLIGTLEDRDEAVESEVGIPLHGFPTVFPHRWYRSPDLDQYLQSIIRDVELIDIQEIWSYPQVSAASRARRADIPYVVTPRGTLVSWKIHDRGAWKKAKKTAYLHLVGNRVLRNADFIHAITPLELEGIRQTGYDGPIAVVPNGLDVETYTRLPPPELAEEEWPLLEGRRVALVLARMSQEKGLDQLIPAFGSLVSSKEFDDSILVLAGPDDRGYLKCVQELVERAGIKSRVLVTGLVEGTRKRALLSRADIYVLPSYSEGFSMSLLEGMASAKPVLITPGCNFPDVVTVGAGLCVPPESGQLLDGMRHLFRLSSEDRQGMGAHGRTLVRENYSWDVISRKMVTLYDSLLSGKEIPVYPDPAPLNDALFQ